MKVCYRLWVFKMASGGSSIEVAEQVPFFDLCTLLQKISDTSGNDKKKKTLKAFVDRWRAAHDRLHPIDGNTTVCIFMYVIQIGWGWKYRTLTIDSIPSMP